MLPPSSPLCSAPWCMETVQISTFPNHSIAFSAGSILQPDKFITSHRLSGHLGCEHTGLSKDSHPRQPIGVIIELVKTAPACCVLRTRAKLAITWFLKRYRWQFFFSLYRIIIKSIYDNNRLNQILSSPQAILIKQQTSLTPAELQIPNILLPIIFNFNLRENNVFPIIQTGSPNPCLGFCPD